MSRESKHHADETLLVYLPCFLDYRLAIDQARKIRELDRNKPSEIKLDIKIMISCNGVELTSANKAELSQITDHVCIFPFGISGDINITQGFVHAIRVQADYLWILSSNDQVSDEFIQTIYEGLIQNREVNILVGCNSDKFGVHRIDSVFNPTSKDIPFGLISSVVYRTKKMAENFDSAVQLNWTGWGQLAAIEAACIAYGEINASLVSEQKLYKRSIRTLENSQDEKNRIKNGYAHSFFGMPILINILYASNPSKRKKYLNAWIFSNWYLVQYFLDTNFILWKSHVASNQVWLRKIAFAAIREASILPRFLFHIFRFVNLNSLQDYRLAQKLRRRIKD